MVRILGDVTVWVGAVSMAGAGLMALVGDRGGFGWWKRARALAQIGAAAMVLASAGMAFGLVTMDWSIEYVADQARSNSSWAYRLAGLWAGAEGSLLWFVTMLGLVVAWFVTYRTGRGSIRNRAAIVIGAWIIAWSAVVVALVADPFVTPPIPAIRGAGLTPILEHPAMLYHPPILYAGLALTLVPYLSAVSGTASRKAGVGAWTLLTIGLATGANWAYVEVGWGGWWAWDPVENTVLIPWLLLTAAVHRLRMSPLPPWGRRLITGLELSPFVFVLFGSAVTRSGGLSSVHAFADSTGLGWTLGTLCWFVAAAPIAVIRWSPGIAWRSDRSILADSGAVFWVAVPATLLVGFAVVVLIGTATPLATDVDFVSADYFQRIGAPVLGVGLISMIVVAAALLVGDLRRAGIAALAGIGLGMWLARRLGIDGALVILVVLASVVAVLHGLALTRTLGRDGIRAVAILAGHLGIAVLVVGVAGTASSQSARSGLVVGDALTLDWVTLTFDSLEVVDGPRPGSEASTARVTITEPGSDPIELQVGLVNYPDRGLVLAETALESTPTRDIQVVATALADGGLGVFAVSVRPAVMWVWWGFALIAAAGLVIVFDRPKWSRRPVGPRRPPPPPAHDRAPRPEGDGPPQIRLTAPLPPA